MASSTPGFLESYKHEAAKKVLALWLSDEYTVRHEQYFGNGSMIFKPDLTTYIDNYVHAFWEVNHTCEVDGKKLLKMQTYCYNTGQDIICYEVDAEWILNQTEKPDGIKKFTYTLTNY